MGEQQPDLAALMAQMQAVIAANVKSTANNVRLEARLRQIEAQNEQQVVTVGGTARPHTFYTERSPIVIPALTVNYEIKASLIHLVEQKQFSGLTSEKPIDHIDRFEKVVGNVNILGVPADYNRCKLFEFSLRDKAAEWLNSLPPRSLNGWYQIRAAFLDNYYTKSMTATLKAQLANFQQFSGENFSDAWARFKSYGRDCPHHGFNDSQLLSIFYDGVDWDAKSNLNAASRGNFMTQSIDGAKELIENLAESYRDRNEEYDRSRKVHSVDSEHTNELVELLKLNLRSNKGVHCADVNAVYEETEENVNFVGNMCDNSKPWYNKPFSGGNQRPFSDPKPYASSSSYPPKSRDDEIKSMFERLLEGQEKHAMSFNGRLDHVYTDLNNKISGLSQKVEQMASHQKAMDIQLAQTAEAVRRQEGSLPARTERNPKANVSAVYIRGFDEDGPIYEVEEEDEEGPMEFIYDEKVAAAMQRSVERHQSSVARHPDVNENSHVNESASASKMVHKPEVTAPVSSEKSELQREKEVEAKRQGILRNVIAEFPSYRFIKNSPAIKSYVKQLSLSKDTVEDSAQRVLKEINAINTQLMHLAKEEPSPPTVKTLEKMESSSRYLVDCNINGIEMRDSLCDTGASVNVMSQAVARRLGLPCHQLSKQPITLADSTTRTATAFVPDVMLKIGEGLVPTDFYIMDIDGDVHRPLILGSPFLATVGAIMDFPNHRVCFSKINKKVFYPSYQSGKPFCTAILYDVKQLSVPTHVPKEVQPAIKDHPKGGRPSPAKRKRPPRPPGCLSIVIPKDLRDVGDDVITARMQGTIDLFPHVSHWQVQNGVLVARGRYGRYLFDPP